MSQDKKKFTGLFIPAEILAMQNISLVEKTIISDIGYFNQGDYRVSNTQMSKKFGVCRRTIINSINRLKSPKIALIEDTGKDDFHRCLRLKKGAISAPFEKAKGAKVAPGSAKVAPLKGAKVAPIDNSNREQADNLKKRGRTPKFVKPTCQQLKEKIREKGYIVDADVFFNHYESNGWKVGRNPMRSWPAALANWNARERKEKGNNNGSTKNSREFAETSKIGSTVAM